MRAHFLHITPCMYHLYNLFALNYLLFFYNLVPRVSRSKEGKNRDPGDKVDVVIFLIMYVFMLINCPW